MKEKPIIFSTPMVQAILEGRKTMTRRVVKRPCCTDNNGSVLIKGFWVNPKKDTDHCFDGISPYCIGDILWVREIFTKAPDGHYIYRADPIFDSCGKGDIPWGWTSPIFMPHKAARIFLEVKNVRIEQLREITPEDKKREGLSDCHRAYPCAELNECDLPCFMKTWEILNAKRGYGWESNPWVWVIEFRRANMREIEFRGKHTQNNEWVFGYLYYDTYKNPRIVNGDQTAYVKPETVGQYTGMIDCNGKRIFEGDIISYWNGTVNECKDGDVLIKGKSYKRTENNRREVLFEHGGFRLKGGNTLHGYIWENKLEIIGNIHDTPELLGRE
jgi:hypothetical protein